MQVSAEFTEEQKRQLGILDLGLIATISRGPAYTAWCANLVSRGHFHLKICHGVISK